MSDTNQGSDRDQHASDKLQFGESIPMTPCGFSFQPIIGLEIEIDETVYMYSDDGNLEISLMGGELEDKASIAEINDALAADLLGKVDRFELVAAGTDTIQGVRGFLNEVYYTNAGEDGVGRALICSPHLNQYFFMLVIASADFWDVQGQFIYDMLKSTIQFHPQFLPDDIQKNSSDFSDLSIDTFEAVSPEEDFCLAIERGDISFLLAARSYSEEDHVAVTQITAPDGKKLYDFDPETGEFSSLICKNPFQGENGEVSIFFPRDNQNTLTPGEYCFSFTTQSGSGLQELHVILRSGRPNELQALDLNFWLAVDDECFYKQENLEQFENKIYNALKERMLLYNMMPGEINFFHPAQDELEAFSSINIKTDLADCSYMISENVDNNRALNIGLVNQITGDDPENETDLKAVSSGSPGMIMVPNSPHSCVLFKWQAFKDDIPAFADAILEQLIIFSGIDTRDAQSGEEQGLRLNHEIAWRIHRHPIFYDVKNP
jgi:hypothetical protein